MNEFKEFNHIYGIKGELKLPGDKSISHRAVMMASLAEGKSIIKNLADGEDVISSVNCFRQLGVEIEKKGNDYVAFGRGFKGLKKPENPLNAGNSATLTRLLTGILAAQDFESIIIGDESLSARPMKRILVPLISMGAKIISSPDLTLPLKIFPSDKLNPITYELPVASAQVKSSVLFAGLHLTKETVVVEKIPSRDHTEKMLGLRTEVLNGKRHIYVSESKYPSPKEYFIPSDISTAVFFIILTLLTNNSELHIKDITLNNSRIGILEILKKMGALIEILNEKTSSGEIYGDIIVRSSKLQNIKIDESVIPNIIDEIPAFTIAGIFAEGDFEIRNAKELRFKETDRIKAVCENLRLTGLDVEEYEDGYKISGKITNKNLIFNSYHDHRIAMTFGILSSLLENGGKVDNFESVKISNPHFLNQLKEICYG
ncbi:MAG TPA: 3-phosphoshikimate 1-carboxyvinyltransferase [Ignavibacteriaceae bacterium]|nr:3-phosphoshikimate 1-carboxyvinyltransferase [Ignavibacteriaceae bacterium]